MNRTSIFGLQRKMGATFIDFYGWEVPSSYVDWVEEYKQVSASAGLIDLSFRGKLKVSGSERASFLNGVVTNDVAKLKPGGGCYALMLNHKGRVLADMTIYCLAEHLLLDVAPQLRAKTKESLERYLISEDVQIELIEGIGHLSIQGPAARQVLEKVAAKDLSSLKDYDHMEFEWLGDAARICKASHTGEEGYDILSKEPVRFWTALVEKGGLRPFGTLALNVLRIEGGIPWYGEDMGEDTIALELPMAEKAISYTKGCYAGQETIARVTYQGRVNRYLVGIRIHDRQPPTKGERILAGDKDVGLVTSACFSPTLDNVLALGFVHRDHAKPGSSLIIGGREAEVIQLPLKRRRQTLRI